MMGIQQSDMKSGTLWNHKSPSAFFQNNKRSQLDQHQAYHKSLGLQRLDSIGEDSNQYQHFQTSQNKPNKTESSMKKRGRNFHNSSFQSLPSYHQLRSRTPSIPIFAPNKKRNFYMTNSPYGSDPKYHRSHSLPDTASCLGNSAMLQPHRPNRSWSFGSYVDQKTLYKCNKDLCCDKNCCYRQPSLLSAVSGSCAAHNLDCDSLPNKLRGSKANNKVPSKMVLSSTKETDCSPREITPECANMSHLKNTSCSSESKSICKESDNECKALDSSPGNSDISILFSPRKTCKKGRPSSKKQKKRKRQKQRHAENLSLHTSQKPPVKADCDKPMYNSESKHNGSDSLVDLDNNSENCLSKKVSTPFKSTSHQHFVHYFLSTPASSDSDNSESDLDEDADDWSLRAESDSACLSPISGCSFSIALNLDSIFKQKHIPSLKSVLTSDSSDDSEAASPSKGANNSMHLSVSVLSLSDVDDFDDSIEFVASSPAHSSAEEIGFGLWKPKVPRKSKDHIEDIEHVPESSCDSDFDVDFNQVNLKWEKLYSTPENCSCCKKNSSVPAGASVAKVKFVEEPELCTVHIVGDEDRAGTWHQYALDRERFERRIKEANQVLSPILMEAHRSAIIKRNCLLLQKHGLSLEGHPGIKIGGSNINNLRYADDTVLIAENEKDLQQLLDIVKEESEKKGLELNRKKTEVMVVSRKQELPIINIYIKGTRLKQKDQFKYLGSLISSDGRNNSEVASRIAQAKTNFQKMKTVLTNKNISIRTRRRALECYIEPILMYGCEAWTISKQTQKKLEATEMWFLRRMLQISWTAKKTNDTVLEEAHTTRLLISKIHKRQATFFGHVMRREKLENLVTTGMLEGKRSRGKQREKLIEGLTDWLKAGKSLEAIEATKDRKKWRTMIANAVKQGT
ncbi:endonuclease-reverse transcriptase [Plakobranchus ocellatus]|uniref:Endonuclease-reverse transcriptase n=1 Tax=Plakobranchus ocellatus TaxID=259542 RepID=A0AAV4AX16_9GAST|nr:endonuclease-reverse transcriptase [Plakobranchus ocellatus]